MDVVLSSHRRSLRALTFFLCRPLIHQHARLECAHPRSVISIPDSHSNRGRDLSTGMGRSILFIIVRGKRTSQTRRQLCSRHLNTTVFFFFFFSFSAVGSFRRGWRRTPPHPSSGLLLMNHHPSWYYDSVVPSWHVQEWSSTVECRDKQVCRRWSISTRAFLSSGRLSPRKSNRWLFPATLKHPKANARGNLVLCFGVTFLVAFAPFELPLPSPTNLPWQPPLTAPPSYWSPPFPSRVIVLFVQSARPVHTAEGNLLSDSGCLVTGGLSPLQTQPVGRKGGITKSLKRKRSRKKKRKKNRQQEEKKITHRHFSSSCSIVWFVVVILFGFFYFRYFVTRSSSKPKPELYPRIPLHPAKLCNRSSQLGPVLDALSSLPACWTLG